MKLHKEALPDYQKIKSQAERLLIWYHLWQPDQIFKDLELPEDDRNIIVTIHYYMPIQFTHQGAPWSEKNKNLSGIEWTNQKMEEQAIKNDFDSAQQWSDKYSRPLHLGEFGVYEKAGMDSRIRWTNL